MTKRMLMDATQPEETRVVVLDGNRLEDVEFESAQRKQIKGNIYIGKVMRVEPSLQACFVDYGGNKHGFMAFSEIHPDYYNIDEEELAELDREVDEIIENKKNAIKEREAERERIRKERAAAHEAERIRREEEARKKAEQANISEDNNVSVETAEATTEDSEAGNNAEKANDEKISNNHTISESIRNAVNEARLEATQEIAGAEAEKGTDESQDKITAAEKPIEEIKEETAQIVKDAVVEAIADENKKHPQKKRLLKKKIRKHEEALEALKDDRKAENSEDASLNNADKKEDKLTVMSEDCGCKEEVIKEGQATPAKGEEKAETSEKAVNKKASGLVEDDMDIDDEDDDIEAELDFEMQRRLIKSRKLFHRNKIQDVIKEGQIILVQVVKEERGNKGAALTTYLSLAGRYCVLMPNRIKSGGVSRKITNASDRNRLKAITKQLPLTPDMSLIVRTAGEEKTKADIVRDYNYLIRTWNQIRIDALKKKAPALIHEEGNLIKRALRDIYTKDTSEVIVAGDEAYKLARDFFKILSPHSLKKIKNYRNNDMPLFQRFQVEGQLDKLHETNAQLESGGYLVINPTEALVSIDVNSGRATKEKDLEETALKTNLEACDEIARQLRMRNLAGLVVIDFIDMDEPANNHAIEKRMKEALKKDRSRIQVGKMSMFGLLELSRQRMHSAFWESNYQTCPHCQGKGIVRTTESSAVFILRGIEEEGVKNRSSQINVFVPTDIAIYLLNQKRKTLVDLEHKYGMNIIISADDEIKCISDYRIERTKLTKEDKLNDYKNNENSENNRDNEKVEEQSSENSVQEAPQNDNNIKETTQYDYDEANKNEGDENPRAERRRSHNDRRHNRFDRRRNRAEKPEKDDNQSLNKEKQEAVILYDSHERTKSNTENVVEQKSETSKDEKPIKEKTTWWKKLIKG